jgi:hypothetical protein
MNSAKNAITLICINLLLLSCNNNSERQKSPNELREDLKIEEQINPTNYLTVTASISQNNGYKIRGNIKNTTAIAKFKDAIIVINYLSETGTIIDTQDYVIYKFFEPNSETLFEYRIQPPAGFKNFNIEIKTATAVN